MKTGRVDEKPEGSSGDHPFALFYARHLERRLDSRIGSGELRDAYLAWAGQSELPALSFKELRSEMVRLGHRHIRSNRMWFTDIAILDRPRSPKKARDLLDKLRLRSERRVAVDRVDAIFHQLTMVRRELTEVRRQLDLPFGRL